MESQRQIRFGELIRSLISDCLLREDFYNEKINPAEITVSFVKMSKDLKIANVYFMPLGGKNKLDILKILNDQKFIFKNFYQKQNFSQSLPKLTFYLDDTFEHAQKIKNLLLNKKVIRDIK